MAQQKYSPMPWTKLTEEQAQRYGARLTELTKKEGFITPSIVVKDAQNNLSPLHDYFVWDNDIAAEKYRLKQASELLRSISITIISGGENRQIRQFFNVGRQEDMEAKEKNVYVTLNTVKGNNEIRAEVIKYALNELEHWKERYQLYSELIPITKFIDKFLSKFDN